MKKIMATVLALAMAFSMTACGSKGTETTAAAAEMTAAAETTAAAAAETTAAAETSAEKITIRIGHSASEENIYQVAL